MQYVTTQIIFIILSITLSFYINQKPKGEVFLPPLVYILPSFLGANCPSQVIGI